MQYFIIKSKKGIVLLLISFLMIISCGKSNVTPSNYFPQSPKDSSITTGNNLYSVDIPATECYAEPWSDNNLGVNISQGDTNAVVNNWVSPTNIGWYLYFQPGKYNIYLNATLNNGDTSSFMFTTSAADSNFNAVFTARSKQIGFRGNGVQNKIFFDSINIPSAGFYKLVLSPKYKSGAYYASLKSLTFTSSSPSSNVRYAQYLSSPSVHLSFSPSDGSSNNYDWFYGEILVPAGYDPEYTFYECMGFDYGYFGMQVNSSIERRILFSIWNSASGNSNSEVPDSLQSKVLDFNPSAVSEGFGNEGSGGHTYLVYPWKTGYIVKFLMNKRLMSDGSAIYTGWFNDNGSAAEWQYMATYKSPKNNSYMNGFYSFIENFGTGTGQMIRRGNYMNMWGKVSGQDTWVSLNKASMSYTDGAANSRSDYAGGTDAASPNRFYMQSGGYLSPVFNATSIISASNTPPFGDMSSFISRVDAAIQNSQMNALNKTNWSIAGFDSQETTGEATPNGFAKAAIDDNVSTYWHSEWLAAQPKFPHYLSVDMGKSNNLNGILINDRLDKSNGRPKDISVLTSNDAVTWTTQISATLQNTTSQQKLSFPASVTCRYFKINITSAYSDGTENVFFTHLAEINAF